MSVKAHYRPKSRDHRLRESTLGHNINAHASHPKHLSCRVCVLHIQTAVPGPLGSVTTISGTAEGP